MNNTARQYNIKGTGDKKSRVTVRLKPGFNVVEDVHWDAVKDLSYVKLLREKDKIDFGSAMDKKQTTAEKSQKAQSKKTQAPKEK